jgi:CBS domain-containing protein
MINLEQRRPVDAADRPVVGLMSQPVFAIPADATLEDALRISLIAGVRHVVVVDGEGRFVGVLGDRQFAAAWADHSDALATVPVSAALDSRPPTVSRIATLRTVARLIRDYQTDVVVVADPGLVAVGLVTAGDVVAAVAQSHPSAEKTRVVAVAK